MYGGYHTFNGENNSINYSSVGLLVFISLNFFTYYLEYCQMKNSDSKRAFFHLKNYNYIMNFISHQ